VRIGACRSGIVVCVCALGALGVAACSKGMLMSDVGTVTGGSGANGAGGRAGAGGGGLACTAADVFMACDVDVAQPPVPGAAGAPCSDDGAHCEGYGCSPSSGGFVWEATCCFGVWLNYSGECPALNTSSRLLNGPSP